VGQQPSGQAGNEHRSDQLVLSHFTLERHHDIADRVSAAAAAGFDGIGLFLGNYIRLRDSGLLGELDDALAEHQMPLVDIEVLSGWGTVGLADERYAEQEKAAWQIADRYGCRYVQAIGSVDEDLAVAGARFAQLCDRASEHGLVVGLEFLPFTNVVDADAATAIVEIADRPNGGLCVDIWHHRRGTNQDEQLRRLDPAHIVGIQMSDGPLQPTDPNDYVADCLRYRVPPGEGEMDAVGFVTQLMRLGVRVPWQLEVCNSEAWGQPGFAHVQAAANGMRSVLAAARDRVAQ
jgi:sugar phosphate isomerase/epimerase